MADVKTGPYEILVRFNCEIGEKFGVVRGTQLATRSFLVDAAGTIVSKVDSGRDDHPHDFPTEDLPAYLGGGFVAFDAQIDNMRAESTSLKADLDTAKAEAGAAKQALSEAREQIVDLTAGLDAAKADAASSTSELLATQKQLSAALAALDSVTSQATTAAATASAQLKESSQTFVARIKDLEDQIKVLNDELDLAHGA